MKRVRPHRAQPFEDRPGDHPGGALQWSALIAVGTGDKTRASDDVAKAAVADRFFGLPARLVVGRARVWLHTHGREVDKARLWRARSAGPHQKIGETEVDGLVAGVG